jgi:hypothetical protein
MAGDEASVEAEYIRWQQLWRQTDLSKRPKTVVEALQSANEFGTYPSIQTLLHIFATSTTERSFSALKYIKNYLRSTMNENRLNGLAHLYINRDIELDYADVIDEFSKTNRRLNFQ